jgi:hypothetical protein
VIGKYLLSCPQTALRTGAKIGRGAPARDLVQVIDARRRGGCKQPLVIAVLPVCWSRPKMRVPNSQLVESEAVRSTRRARPTPGAAKPFEPHQRQPRGNSRSVSAARLGFRETRGRRLGDSRSFQLLREELTVLTLSRCRAKPDVPGNCSNYPRFGLSGLMLAQKSLCWSRR